jgi:hypothetical protein
MEWYRAVEIITPHVVRITTPQGTGSGFLVTQSSDDQVLGIATAAHVVDHAHYWEQPIRVQFAATGETRLLRAHDRAIVLDEGRDTAVILMPKEGQGGLPAPMPLIPEGLNLKVGNTIGWLGYPAISGSHLCFFTGTVSAWVDGMSAYFVDGVAINGVSGGPAFITYPDDALEIIGVVSAYMPNRVTGETLPGLGIIRDVYQFQELIRNVRSFEEAKSQETPPADAPPPPAPTDEPGVQSSARKAS